MSKPVEDFVVLLPISKACFDFTPDGLQVERRTAIIAPIILQKIDDDTKQIGWACSRGKYCADPDCHYAKRTANTDDIRPIETLGHLDR